jgi:hypothetical protein
MSPVRSTNEARERRTKFRLPKREQAALKRQIQYLDDRTRYLVVSSLGARFDLYYDVKDDLFTWKDPTGGTVFKRRSMAAAVARLLGAQVDILECRVNKKGLLVKRSVRVGKRGTNTRRNRRRA